MKKNLKNTTLLFSMTLAMLFGKNASAKTENFEVFNQEVSFDLPSDWQSINKEVGVPLKLIGPLNDGRRPIILFVPIDMKFDKMIFENKTKSEENYKISRLAWLQTFNGKSISFLPFETFTTSHKIDFFQFGYLYQFADTNFEEKSYYINCKKKMFHIKSLIQVEQVSLWSSSVKKIIDSFSCK